MSGQELQRTRTFASKVPISNFDITLTRSHAHKNAITLRVCVCAGSGKLVMWAPFREGVDPAVYAIEQRLREYLLRSQVAGSPVHFMITQSDDDSSLQTWVGGKFVEFFTKSGEISTLFYGDTFAH